ncbi:CapA family protein [Pseudofrankia inefficax]|uniref:Capsule synthesis protein, CapA n=1 Tax=Pseudofrankia inefficax (strain DSM 45817 / CECT 9037 / DDB 130130 / EuI1c) TaxID=298654 RepID=E3IU13_PSEI1|nr:CapA family protein [Pseudofrankia inefficax]ADP81206.1 Capsule synthesis protein, CapA [Pseudofrankia inefficax]
MSQTAPTVSSTDVHSTGVVLAAVGDVFLDRPDPGRAFSAVDHLLRDADIAFGNSEGVYARDPDRAPSAGVAIIGPPQSAAPLAPAGFAVLSLANNHIGDAGPRALLENIRLFTDQGIAVAGAGGDQAAAHAPALLERHGVTVAFLAYSSTFPSGYEARAAVPGLAPLRSYNLFRPYEHGEWSPGLAPQVVTVPHEQDHEMLRSDVEKARTAAGVVVVSIHAGDFTRPFVLTDHERRAARLAIDAGADVVLGHHHHLLRGIEFYRGKPILYGLGHFAFDLPDLDRRLRAEGYLGESSPADSLAARRRAGEYRLWPQPGYPLLPFHPDARMTMIAVLRLSPGQPVAVGLVPCTIAPDGRPEPHLGSDADGARVLDYLTRCCEAEDLAVRVRPDAWGQLAGHPVTLVEAA